MKKIVMMITTALAAIALMLAGCTGLTLSTSPTGATSTQPVAEAKTGTVQMWVTDAPRSDNISEIWVTVNEVKIHEASVGQASDSETDEAEGEIDESADNGGWISINMTGPNRFDLLTLRGESGGIQQILATANLSAGRYTQIRMIVDKVEVTIDGVTQNATLPSGNLKFVHPFDIEADSVTKLLFDFDADKFITVTGSPKNPRIMAKPVVKLIVSKPQNEGASIKITTPGLPNGAVGTTYNGTLTATGGTLPYTWSIASGNLTGGLTLSPEGIISGTPEAGQAGIYTFLVEVSDNSTPANSDTREYTITIAEAGVLIISTTSLADGIQGAEYNARLDAIGGTLPYSWNVTIGNLPNGLELAAGTGIISGNATIKGNYNFTVEVTDNATMPNSDNQQFSIRITEN